MAWVDKRLDVSGVYQVVNLENGHRYVGSSVHVGKRLDAHLRALRRGKHTNRHLGAAFRKYGADRFASFLIETAPADQLEAAEQKWLSVLWDRGWRLP